jgi:protease I
MDNITGLRVAILITDRFELVEMMKPRQALDQAGARASIVSPKHQDVRLWNFVEWGQEFPVDLPPDSANPGEFDAISLSGGVMNPDKLRMDPKAVKFAKAFFDADKPVAVICHGPWTVIETGYAKGKKIAFVAVSQNGPAKCRSSVDGSGSGCRWQAGVSRKPDDIPAFNREMLKLFGQIKHPAGRAA